MRSRFETPPARFASVLLAIALDGAHLLAYFTGRVIGLSWLLRHHSAEAAAPAAKPDPVKR